MRSLASGERSAHPEGVRRAADDEHPQLSGQRVAQRRPGVQDFEVAERGQPLPDRVRHDRSGAEHRFVDH